MLLRVCSIAVSSGAIQHCANHVLINCGMIIEPGERELLRLLDELRIFNAVGHQLKKLRTEQTSIRGLFWLFLPSQLFTTFLVQFGKITTIVGLELIAVLKLIKN